MAILSMKEFAVSMNISYDTVKKNAQRGNIIKGTNNKIDTENPTNKLFFNKQMVQNSASVPNKKKETVEKVDSVVKKVEIENVKYTKHQKELLDIDRRKKLADLDLAERGADLKRMQLEKAAGNLLPVDLVNIVFATTFQSVLKTFNSEIESLARIYVERFGGEREDLVEITKNLRLILSRIIEKSEENSQIELTKAIDTYK